MTKPDKTPDTANPMASVLEAMQSATFPELPKVGTEWIEHMADYGQEVLSFMAQRVAEDVQTQHALMHAKGVAEVQHIQAQFFQKVMDDYAAETAKLMKIGQTFAPDVDRPKDV